MSASTWHLTTAEVSGRPSAALSVNDELHIPAFLRGLSGAIEVLHAWEALEPELRGWTPEPSEVVEGRLLQPLQFPRKVLCSGPNFTDHLAEMGESRLGDAWTGYFFLKPPTTSLIADAEPILVEDLTAARADYEGELALVIGRGGRRIEPADALGHVAGYLVANDVSLRGPHRRDTPAKPFQWDWLASKGADTSLPLGPGVVPAWQVPDPQALRIRTWVNGQLKQNGTTADMVLDVARLIADASALVTLEPGDLILTGTPAGVGASSGSFLADGDEVRVEISGVGSISNRIRERGAHHDDDHVDQGEGTP